MPFKELEKHTQRVKEPVKRDSTVYTSGEHQVTFGGEGCQEEVGMHREAQERDLASPCMSD